MKYYLLQTSHKLVLCQQRIQVLEQDKFLYELQWEEAKVIADDIGVTQSLRQIDLIDARIDTVIAYESNLKNDK